MGFDNQIKLTFDNELLDEYSKHYFELYPRRKKKPIEDPLHPSINKWFIMKRPQMNDLKQKWKDFVCWVVQHHNYQGLGIDKCTITYKYYFNTKRKQDTDNRVPKFLNDGLVESGMLVEDNYNHVNPITIWCGYDKEHPRMEVVIDY